MTDPSRGKLLLFLSIRLAGLVVIAAGIWLGRGGHDTAGLLTVLAGGATLLVRPRHLGLTGRR